MSFIRFLAILELACDTKRILKKAGSSVLPFNLCENFLRCGEGLFWRTLLISLQVGRIDNLFLRHSPPPSVVTESFSQTSISLCNFLSGLSCERKKLICNKKPECSSLMDIIGEDKYFWLSWRCFRLKPFISSTITTRSFSPCRRIPSSTDALKDGEAAEGR